MKRGTCLSTCHRAAAALSVTYACVPPVRPRVGDSPPVPRSESPIAVLPPSTRSTPHVVLADRLEALEPHVSAWEDLAAAAIEPNVFFEPWMLLPAVRAFGGGVDLRFLFIYDREPGELIGVFPLERRRFWKLPMACLGVWQHKHCFLGTPLVRTGCGPAALKALFDWLVHDDKGTRLVEFPRIPCDGPFARVLDDVIRMVGRPSLVTGRQERALLTLHADDCRADTVLSGPSRRALRRRQRRLAEAGQLVFEAVEPGADARRWIEEFLHLEAAGWKGRMGTAMACNAAEVDYFRAIAGEAAERGRLLALTLRLGGRPIACRCAFRAGDGAFAFKSAFDEQFAASSPGVLLELENIRRCRALPGLRWMDSCTSPDNEMINRLWQGRRTLHTVTVATGRRGGDLAVRCLNALQSIRHRLRSRVNNTARRQTPPSSPEELV